MDQHEVEVKDPLDDEDDGSQTPGSAANLSSSPEGDFQSHHLGRSATYNYASEKSVSLAEAKLYYNRHQFESTVQDHDAFLPLTRTGTVSSTDESEGGLSRAASAASARKGRKGGEKIRKSPSIIPSHGKDAVDLLDPGPSGTFAQDVAQSQADPFTSGRTGDVEAGLGTRTTEDSDITPELSAISNDIRNVLDIRHKYLRLSLQQPFDNPKDHPGWDIYPPPPEPTWDEENNRPRATDSGPGSLSNSKVLGSEHDGSSHSPARRKRKPGHDIGSDFDMADILPIPGEDEGTNFHIDSNSVYQLYKSSARGKFDGPLVPVPTLRDFYMDLEAIQNVSSDGPTKSFAYRELDILEGRFNLYHLENAYQETMNTKAVPHRDFYNVRKVDTHVHHSSCFNQKHLLRFIKSKMKKSPDEVVMFRDGKELTLKQVFDSIDLKAYDLSIDTLDMHASGFIFAAHTDSFHRFDKFNLKYNPVGESRLREIFLKTDNYIKGRYLAEITREVISDLEASKYQMVEWRISVYGKSLDEWDKLAAWVVDNKIFSHNVRWLVQVPRLYDVYKKQGLMANFEQVIVNVFQPLYEVTKDPSKHPELHIFLQRVIGFDSVDDESKIERRFYKKFPIPCTWDTGQNPPYSYWIYYLFANLVSLNTWRKRRGFTTFLLRPHCGEAGDPDHLAAAVLCCHSISHGLLLRKVPLLQYIFYLDQIGVAMSPLSNNALFLAYERNPFLQYFRRGLNISLSTDDPLQIAFTKEPLIEEYSVAAQIYKLSAVDMCELAHHSVMQSGFEHQLKQRWLGDDYHLLGVKGNNVAKSNVPNNRERFRQDTWLQELAMLERFASWSPRQPDSPSTPRRVFTIPTSSPSIAARLPKIPISYSSIDMKDPDYRSAHDEDLQRARSSSMLYSPGSDSLPREPRVFPGIVHERHRRNSIRMGGGSEKDFDGAGMTGSTVLDDAVAEEEGEEVGGSDGH